MFIKNKPGQKDGEPFLLPILEVAPTVMPEALFTAAICLSSYTTPKSAYRFMFRTLYHWFLRL
jgi:hypothetical protein